MYVALNYTLIEPKDGDFNYYVKFSSSIPYDHPLTFIFLNTINFFTNNPVMSVNILEFLAYGLCYFSIFLVTEKITDNILVSFLASVFPMYFVLTFDGTQLKTVLGLVFFMISAFLLMRYDNKKSNRNLFFLAISVLCAFATHIVATFFVVCLLGNYGFRKRKTYLFILLIITFCVICSCFFIPYSYSFFKVFWFLKGLNVESFFSNLLMVFSNLSYLRIYMFFPLFVFGLFISKKFNGYYINNFVVLTFLLCSVFLLHFGVNPDYTGRFFMILPFMLAPLFSVSLKSVLSLYKKHKWD